MFDHLPQNQTRIFSSLCRAGATKAMKKADALVKFYLPLVQLYPEDVWDIMDCNNQFVYANENLNRLVGLSPNYDFVGRHMSEPPAACYEVSSTDFVEQNNLCVNCKKDMKVLDIHPGQNGEWWVNIFHKQPIMDGDEVAGTLHHGYDVLDQWKESVAALQKLSRYYTGSDEVSLHLENPKPLSDGQAEALFFLLCQKSPKEIARLLNMTTEAVNSRIAVLKQKLGVRSIKQIVEVAIANNLHKQLPSRLTGKQLSLIIDP